MEDKRVLRKWVRQRLRRLPHSVRTAAEQRVHAHLDRLLADHTPSQIAAYVALPEELSLAPWLQSLDRTGVRLVLPAYVGRQPCLRVVDDLRALVRMPEGFLAPPAGAPLLEPSDLDLALVPGLAFDPRGRRLGRGSGFYDRLLSQLAPSARIYGVAFAFQVLPALPNEPHDLAVQAVVTELGVEREGRGGRSS